MSISYGWIKAQAGYYETFPEQKAEFITFILKISSVSYTYLESLNLLKTIFQKIVCKEKIKAHWLCKHIDQENRKDTDK